MEDLLCHVSVFQISTSVMLRLLHATEMLFVVTLWDPMHVPVTQDSLETEKLAMVCSFIRIEVIKLKLSFRPATFA